MTNETTTAPIERFRKKPIEVEMILWDGTPERAAAIQDWVGVTPEMLLGFITADAAIAMLDVRTGNALLYVAHNNGWADLPVGHRVAKEADGSGFYPVSPAAIAETFEAVER